MSGTYVGAEQVMIEEWIKTRLAAQASALETISTGLSTRVRNGFGSPSDKFPFIVYQCQVPPKDVRGVGPVRVMVDTLFIVKAIGQCDDYLPLTPVARVIDTALTAPDTVAVTDGFILCSTREDGFSMVEIDSGKQFRHLGGQFKILAQAV